jgi:HlyD family secretion protein
VKYPVVPQSAKRWLTFGLIVVLAAGGYYAWDKLRPQPLPKGFGSANGRIEAVNIDIAAKIAGRIKEILVDEGDFISAEDVLVRMDTAVLQAQRPEAEAQLKRAQISIETAKSLTTQREAEKEAALATVAQREAELDAAQRRLARAEELAPKGAVTEQRRDDDRAQVQAARAAVSAAKAQVAAAEAAIGAAKSQVIDAQAAVDVTQAVIQRIQADIDDSVLVSPRDGRVQYRVAQVGEVLSAGGRVLNMVDLADVYMTFFLPTEQAGRVRLGSEVRLVLDAIPQIVIPAQATFVADVAQFTPKAVETAEERQKLMFRIKARIPPELLRQHIRDVKTGLPGLAYVRLDPEVEWPAKLAVTPPP